MNPIISGELASQRERSLTRKASRRSSRQPTRRRSRHRDETVFRSSPSSELA